MQKTRLLLFFLGFVPIFAWPLWGAAAGEDVPRAAEAEGVEYLETRRSPGHPGGDLVVAMRSEPQTFNPLYARDNTSRTVTGLLTATLVYLDRETHEPVAALAKSWTTSADGRRITFELRRGLRFSDGHPFDADDVVFSFGVHLDKEAGSIYYCNLVIGGEGVRVRKTGSHRVEIELAAPSAEGVSLVDAIVILPRHRLEKAYREGRLKETWGLATPGDQIVGLGPFRLERYAPGERLTMRRNPHYWKVDAAGQPLPYLERVNFVFVPDEDARVLRFQSGETHLIERLNGRSFNRLTQAKAKDKAKGKAMDFALRDLGPGLDFHFLFFNLNDVDPQQLGDLARKQGWFRQQAFRQAVALAIDRDSIARLVYGRRATPIASHITTGNKRWSHPGIAAPRHAPEEARQLLKEAGFSWRDAELIDPEGHKVEFSITLNSGNRERAGMFSIIQEDLRRLGIDVRAVTVGFLALTERITKTYEYDAAILGLPGYTDPDFYMSMWSSGGGFHLWRLTPSSADPPWQKDLDRLMREQRSQLDYARRKSLYDQVQTILAEEQPFILLVSPNVLVGANPNLGNFAPSILDHSTLWNVDELYWKRDGTASPR